MLSIYSQTLPASGIKRISILLSGDNINNLLNSSPPDLMNSTELEIFLDSIMEEQLERYEIPGATVAVVKNDTIIFSKGYGFADVEQEKPVIANQTLFRIGSISKIFVWTAVMQLWEQGKLDLDEDINNYLTTFQIPTTFPEPITLNHLMSHSAGFEERLYGIWASSPDDLRTLAEYCANEMPTRVRPPGQLCSYSNYGSNLAGYIVELISGIAFEEYIAEYIYKPLGMTQSTFIQPPPPEMVTNLSKGHSLANKDGVFNVQGFEYIDAAPGGAMSATATDMAKFIIAHLQNGTFGNSSILEETTAQKMHNKSFSQDPRVNGWAHGWMEVTLNGQHFIHHRGGTQWFQSSLALSLEHNMGLFVCYNNPKGSLALGKLIQALLDQYFPTPESTPPEPLSDHKARVNRFVGVYRLTRSSCATIDKILISLGSIYISADEEGRLVMQGLMMTPSRFIEVEPLLFLPVDENGTVVVGGNFIAFRENNQGQITHLFHNNSPMYAHERTTWAEDPFLHLFLMFFCLLLFFIAILLEPLTFAVRKLRKKKQNPLPESPTIENRMLRWLFEHGRSLTSWLSAGTSGLFFLFLILFLYEITQMDFIAFGVHPLLYLIFTVPIVAAILTGFMTFFIGIAWKERYWGLVKRTFHTIVLVTCLIFLMELNYWNLLGFNF